MIAPIVFYYLLFVSILMYLFINLLNFLYYLLYIDLLLLTSPMPLYNYMDEKKMNELINE